MLERRLALISAPFSGGAGIAGCELAPAALQEAGLARALRSAGRRVREEGLAMNDCGPAARATVPQLIDACRRVCDAVMMALTEGELPVVLGGDHSLAIGSLAGVTRNSHRHQRPLWVLWLDAHADFNTFATSPSGNVHGMPAAVACGLGDPRLLGLSDGAPWVDASRIRMIGVRAIDTGESELLHTRRVRVTPMDEVRGRGLTTLIDEVLTRVAAENGHLHVSIDVDVMDPAVAPGVGSPEPDGLEPDEMHAALRRIAASGLLGSLDVMELNPLKDRDGMTARLAVELVESVLGDRQVLRYARAL